MSMSWLARCAKFLANSALIDDAAGLLEIVMPDARAEPGAIVSYERRLGRTRWTPVPPIPPGVVERTLTNAAREPHVNDM